jgi:hypothetical protein
MTDNPFLALSMPEVFGYIYKEYGGDGLGQVLDELKKQDIGWREPYECYANELRSVGLHKVAAIMNEYIPTMQSLDQYLEERRAKYHPPEYYETQWNSPEKASR